MSTSSATTLAMLPPRIESFFDLYSQRSSDPFDRDYRALMLEFAEFPNELRARYMFNMVEKNEGPVGAYIGMFTHPGHEAGRSMVVHGVKKYVHQLGDRASEGVTSRKSSSPRTCSGAPRMTQAHKYMALKPP
jgi:hypothetical protein